jgi:hypothetical protein
VGELTDFQGQINWGNCMDELPPDVLSGLCIGFENDTLRVFTHELHYDSFDLFQVAACPMQPPPN